MTAITGDLPTLATFRSMTEAHLHYIWKNRLFDRLTVGDERVRVLKVGQHNLCDGPDFSLARVAWQDIEWCGSVEMHLRASDWGRHAHDNDPRYDGVVLHVVLDDDARVLNTKGEQVPTAVMHISSELIDRMETMDIANAALRCAPEVSEVSALKVHSILDRLAVERLQAKVVAFAERADDDSYHSLFYHTLMRYLGAHSNNDAMTLVAQHLPYIFLKKHAGDIIALEAMLLGQAALISDDPRDDYEARLRDEYLFYARKFDLSPVPKGLFRKLRVRPYSYPARRLAIMAALITQESRIMTAIAESDQAVLADLLSTPPSEYWCRHYDFGHESGRKMGGVGDSTVRLLLINAIIPTAYHYHSIQGNTSKALEAAEWLAKLSAEDNHIVRLFDKQGISPRHASDSQAIIHLYNSYCTQGGCLRCPVAPEIFRALTGRSR
ncbi:DUF2851 family protein [Porphyromonas sp.]|uniref:DUF2851 family protein n=1 Tax=Porphyromonas sp. TaxID=1924944 RepID=UPI0026DC20D6|nr:DUF2851 family protein [Porphyromonas sp.]MDO4771650.1 DUF2851 family protein [Porphyromonas sp.]